MGRRRAPSGRAPRALGFAGRLTSDRAAACDHAPDHERNKDDQKNDKNGVEHLDLLSRKPLPWVLKPQTCSGMCRPTFFPPGSGRRGPGGGCHPPFGTRSSSPEAWTTRTGTGAMERYDVVVVGGGVAGASALYHLAERGVTPLAPARADSPRGGLRGALSGVHRDALHRRRPRPLDALGRPPAGAARPRPRPSIRAARKAPMRPRRGSATAVRAHA